MNAVLFSKNSFGLAVALAVGLCVFECRSTTFDVPANTEVTAGSSASYDEVNIEGVLTVPSGVTITGTATKIGGSSAGSLIIDGGTFGDKNYCIVGIGENGGTANISLANGGKFNAKEVDIKSKAGMAESGYIDFMTSVGDNTLTFRNVYNHSDYTSRIQVASGLLTHAAAASSARWFQNGTGVNMYEIAENAEVRFARQYWEVTLNNGSSAKVLFSGKGRVSFSGSGSDSKNLTVNNGVTFNNAGGLLLNHTATKLVIANGVEFGDSFGTFETKGVVLFGGAVNLGDIVATDDGKLMGPTAGAIITLGHDGRSSIISGAAFAEDTTLTLKKIGAGELTVSETTPFLPALDVEGGSVRIKGVLSCSKITLLAGTSVVVDGGCWTIDGAQLEQAAGAMISTVNKGNIILKVTATEEPTFAPGMTLDVLEYWVDGVRQPNGTYSCGGATIVAFKYAEDDLTIWTNEGKQGESHAFASGEQYKGFSLVRTDVPLCFTGGPVVLGSEGIVVDKTSDAAATFDFGLPVMAAVSQTWDFGTASAVFRQPLVMAKGVADDPALEIRSDAALEFATTNSTFVGTLTASGRTIRVAGPMAFGAATSVALNVDGKCFSDAAILLDGVTTAGAMSIKHYGSDAAALVFSGTNTFGGRVDFTDATRARYLSGSKTCFVGGATYFDYNEQGVYGDAVIVYGDLNLSGYANSRCLRLEARDRLYGGTVRFDGEIHFRDTTEYDLCLYGVRAEMGLDHAFTEGLVWINENTIVDLSGKGQRMTRLSGAGVVSSTAEAFLEIDTPTGSTATNTCKFTDHASFKMVGAGTLRLMGVSDSAGAFAVENGCVVLDAAWTNVSSVSVSGAGILEIVNAKNIGKTSVLSLAGTGGLILPSGGIAKVSELRLTDPSTGETSVFTTGSFDASNSFGLISGGTVQVGETGLMLILR